MRYGLWVAAGMVVLATACESSTDVPAVDQFAAALNAASVKPTAPTSAATGSLNITLRSDSSTARYALTFSGLSSAATAMHIHGPAADTATGGILVDFGELAQEKLGSILLGTSGEATGAFDLHDAMTPTVSGDSLFKLLHAGLLYVDVHTAGNSAGEIRGQIRK